MRITRNVLFALLFVGLSITGVSLFSATAHAQTTGTSTDTGILDSTLSTFCSVNLSNPLCAAYVAAPVVQKAADVGAAVGSCVSDGIGECIIKTVASVVLAFANWLLGVAGVLFNLIMIYGVFQFGNTVGNSPGVLVAWGILRDLANMALLFGFIFMGIATILDTGAVQNFTAKRALPALLIFAVLMNFSLFTCEAMIDISNALSSTIYAQANTSPCAGGATASITDTSCGVSYGLAGHIMQSTGLAGIWAVQGDTPLGSQAFAFFGLALFATIGAIVFFAASIMLAIRVIMLTLLMVVSPIGFAGMAIPPLRNLAGDWWTRVIHQAFYAPIMLLLILISLKIADSFTVAGGNNGLGAAVLSQDTSAMGVFVVFMLIIGFMVASLIAANRFGAAGATAAVGFGKKVVLGSYGGVAGFAGRRTIGAASNYAQKSYKSNTTLRRAATIARLDSGIIKATDAGKNAKFAGRKSFADVEKETKERKKVLTQLDDLDAVKQASKSTGDAAKDAANKTAALAALKRLSDTDMPDLIKTIKGNEDALKLVAESMSPEKFEKLMSNKEFDDTATKAKMKDLRYQDLATAVAQVNTAAAKYLASPADPVLKKEYEDAQKSLGEANKRLGKKDAGSLAESKHAVILSDPTFAASLSEDQFKGFRDSDNLSAPQKSAFEDARNKRQNDAAYVALTVPTMKKEDIEKLKSDVLADPRVLNAMSGRQLVSIDPDKVDSAHIKTIVDHIKNIRATDPSKGPEFQAHLLGNVKNKEKWNPYDIK